MSSNKLNTLSVFFKILTLALALNLGIGQSSYASDLPASSTFSTKEDFDLMIGREVNHELAKSHLEVNQRVETNLLKIINELKSNYSLADSAAAPILLAAGGTIFFFYSGNSLQSSFAISAGYGFYRFLISQYHHYRRLNILNTALTSTREEKIQLELNLASMSEAK